MDRNTIIGIALIAVMFIGYSVYTSPSKEDIEAAKRKQDSIVKVEIQKEKEAIETANQLAKTPINAIDTTGLDSTAVDSLKNNALYNKYGSFAGAAEGENKFITLENNLIKAKISTKGGRLYSVQLKGFRTHDSLPLILFNGDSTIFGLVFHEQQNLNLFEIKTNDLYFTSSINDSLFVASAKAESVSLRLNAGIGRFIEYTYSLKPNSNMLDFSIKMEGLDKLIAPNENSLTLKWNMNASSFEKGSDFENNYTGIYYKYKDDEVDYLTETSADANADLRTKTKWIAFKNQFFSSVIIAKDAFQSASVKHTKIENNKDFLKNFDTEINIPFDSKQTETVPMSFYFGPNNYKTLKAYNLDLDQLVPLGWGIFGWINKYLVIPVFNFLSSFISSYGIIILLLTLFIKLLIFPLTFKSYQSTAKMKVLKPQIDEINERISKDKPMERQQATMALYKRVGVSPFGGCLPLLIQMPILFAMFRFFPASIELRQQSFLWADDLSSYDSILNLPFTIPFYGNHVSLFCLLMTISTIFYTKMQNQMNPSNSSMPGMKAMMYMMPLMFLFMFNNYSSGLSYYYLLANIITFGQMYIMRYFVDEEEVLRKLEANKKKPVTKSKFQERLEQAAKKRGYQLPKK